MAAVGNLLNPAVIDFQEIVVGGSLCHVLVAVEVQVLHVYAELGSHKVGDDVLEVLALDVLAQGLLGDFPRQAYSGGAVLDLAGFHASAVVVVRVLGLFADDAAVNANLVDFTSLGGAHLMAHEAAEVGGLKGLLDESPGLFRVQQARGQAARLNGRFANDGAVIHCLFSSLLLD